MPGNDDRVWLVRWIDRLSGGSGWLIAWLIFPLIVATGFEVFSRYLFNRPTIWAFELGYMAMGVHFLIGAAYTLREGAHIRIDVLYVHLPPKARAIIDIAGYLILFLPSVGLVTWGLWDYWTEALESGERSGQSAWNPVIWPFRLLLFTGLALLLLQGVAELIKAVRVLTGKPPARDATHTRELT